MGLDVAALRKSLNHGNGDVGEVRNASPYFHEQNTGFPWISHHYHEPILIPCYMFLAQRTILIKSEVLHICCRIIHLIKFELEKPGVMDGSGSWGNINRMRF